MNLSCFAGRIGRLMLLCAAALLVCGAHVSSAGKWELVPEAAAQRYSEFIPNDFLLFWPNPVRAHPNVPVRFRFSVYEMSNQPLTWRLTGAPSGMSVGADGRVNWTPTAQQVGTYTVTVRVTRSDGAFRERTFTVNVNTTSFLFVSTTGSDSNPGTISQPFRTISKAMYSIQNGAGKTIYIRGGTYQEVYNWESSGVISPFRDKSFSAANPLEIVGYPGENVILDCKLQGHGFWFFRTNYAVLDNVTVINANAAERGGIVVSDSSNIMIRDTVVHDAHWSYTQNCTGYNVGSGDTVLDGAIGYNNRDPNSDHWNSSNFLFYMDQAGPGDTMYVLNSKAWGSVTGFKIKHAGAKKIVMHRCESFNHDYGYVIGSTYSSVRYSVSFQDKTGIHFGVADPNAYTSGTLLADHNTVVNSTGAALNIQDGYAVTGPANITNNIFVNTVSSAGSGENDNRLLQLWLYDTSPLTHAINSDYNLFFSPSQSNIVRLGKGTYQAVSFSAWKTLGRDTHSVFADPGFANPAGGNFGMPVGSPAGFADGSFAGYLRPGLSGSLIGLPTSQPPPLPPSGVRVEQTS